MREYPIDEKTGYILPVQPRKGFMTPEQKVKVLEQIRANMTDNKLRFDIQTAAKAAGITKKTITTHLELDPKFASDYYELKEEWLDSHEENIAEFGKKNFVASLALLKANRPDKWREKSVVQHQSSEGNMKEVMKRMKEKGYLIDVEQR